MEQAVGRRPDEEFEVEFALSGITAAIPRDKSILAVAEENGIDAPYSCRQGTCGSCETAIAAGQADHRDLVIPVEERDLNRSLMICVSRNAPGCRRLVLDL